MEPRLLAGESACPTGWDRRFRLSTRGPLLFGYLLATGSYKFRVLDGCIGARGLAAFGLLGARWRDCRQERGRHVGQFGFLFRGQRLDEVRGHHHQQFVGGFLGAAAAEDLAENGQIAQPGNLHQGFDHAVVDQARDGEALAVLITRLSIRPAMAKLSPSLRMTSVSARRWLSAGITNPWSVTALAKSRLLTSGATFRSIDPWGVTVGVNSSFTPKGLNCTVTTGAVPPPVGVVVMVGNGKLPPARNEAS